MPAIRTARRFLAKFCVALCIALTVQTSIVVLDRLQHVWGIEHAPNVLAGPIDHEHDADHRHSHHHAAANDHEGLQDQQDDANPLSHRHQGCGILTAWLCPPLFSVVAVSGAQMANPAAPPAHPDVAERRRERPPKVDWRTA